MRGKHRVQYDSSGIRIWSLKDVASIPFDAIRRIGYVTENTGLAITDDHFVALQTERDLALVALSLPGAKELADFVDVRFGCVYGEKGRLDRSTDNDSVVVWPPDEAGGDLYAAIRRGTPPADLQRHYYATE